MRTTAFHRPNRRGSSQRGIAIIEAMVGIMIFAFGVLGLVGLQATMTKAQSGAKFRAEAMNLGNELLGTMWADAPANLPRYVTAQCAGHAPCADWDRKLKRMLPAAGSRVIWDAANQQVQIEITWTRPGEGSSRYVASAVIS
ncbi:pilus assembly protein PilV [Paucibacter sp. Y2R2-4]|uniref:type IV pilus modification PilV family protein n=1 Tax=Paucibacter sp. Y2R2-4 TaxID=2893553 RepID=UPI0021E4C76A|nr:pilus assembly protein PilV [Paucibacter sp. Y2R2-4]MCV2350018.1 pilus assembly protein PilV [Paucibacter sp. Y2R2-4]